MTLISNVYLTHGLMLLCACAATYAALPESTGRIVPEWRPAVTPLLAAMAALSLIAYPTWGELKNPGLWMFASLPLLRARRAATGYGSMSIITGVCYDRRKHMVASSRPPH